MKVLLVGSGGREHALAAALRDGGSASEIFAAPGNAGIAKIADVVPISAASVIELADFAQRVGVGITVIGPELPLTLGIVDEFHVNADGSLAELGAVTVPGAVGGEGIVAF